MRRRKPNLAIATGAVSGLVVVDVDAGKGGEASLAELERQFGSLPRDVVSKTGGGGQHILLRHPGADFRIKNRTNLRPGIDIRADGGYIVAPPSVHPDGVVYEWATKVVHPPAAPGWLLDLVGTESAGRTESAEIPRDREKEIASALSALSVLSVPQTVGDAIGLTVPTGVGQRHRAIFDFARALKAVPDCADCEAEELEPYLRQWFEKAKAHIGTKDYDETLADFHNAWVRVKYPMGQGRIEAAIQRVKAGPPPAAAERYEGDDTRLLVAICRELQREAGEGPFYLSICLDGRPET